MVEPESSNRIGLTWVRRYSVVLAIVSAGLLCLQCWRWARGHGHWYDALPALAFLTLALTNVFERPTKYALQFISLVILIAAIVTLITRL
jgi:hypothetical protein